MIDAGPFAPFIDKYGLLVMANGDGGDSPMKTSFFAVGQYFGDTDAIDRARLRSAYDKALAEISVSEGVYFRHPETWNDPKDLSRDQTWPMMAACGLMGLVGRLDSLIANVWRNFSRAQNGDICGPDIWAAMIRLKRMWYLWPLLWVFDIAHLVNSLILCFWKGRDPDNVGDDNNHVMHIWVSMESLATPVSWFARAIYVWYRPRNYGCFLESAVNDEGAKAQFNGGVVSNVHPVIGAFRWYWRASSGAPPMAKLWEPLLTRLF